MKGILSKDTQKHIVNCAIIRNTLPDHNKVKYGDLKSKNTIHQLKVVKCVSKNLEQE